jgi:hypothetical protein
MTIIRTLGLRVLSGKDTPDVVADLSAQGFSKEKLEKLFSTLRDLTEDERQELRFWALSSLPNRPQWFGLETEITFRSVVDNGFVVGVVPFSQIRLRIKPSEAQNETQEQSIRIDMDIWELTEFLATLGKVKEELENATKSVKSRFNQALATG